MRVSARLVSCLGGCSACIMMPRTSPPPSARLCLAPWGTGGAVPHGSRTAATTPMPVMTAMATMAMTSDAVVASAGPAATPRWLCVCLSRGRPLLCRLYSDVRGGSGWSSGVSRARRPKPPWQPQHHGHVGRAMDDGRRSADCTPMANGMAAAAVPTPGLRRWSLAVTPRHRAVEVSVDTETAVGTCGWLAAAAAMLFHCAALIHARRGRGCVQRLAGHSAARLFSPAPRTHRPYSRPGHVRGQIWGVAQPKLKCKRPLLGCLGLEQSVGELAALPTITIMLCIDVCITRSCLVAQRTRSGLAGLDSAP